MQRHLVHIAAVLAVCFLTLTTAFAQTSSGDITGAVLDPSGQMVVGAEVTLINQETGEQRVIKTDGSGLFIFPVLQPGTYTVSVQNKGFKEYVKRDLHLSASERLSTGNIRLQVGAVTETVDVTSQGASVQTQSSERSALLDNNELTNLMTPGRDVLALVRILPGVVKDGEGGQQLGTESAGAVSGTREVGNSISVDGINGNPRGGGNRFDTPLNMEAVGEVKVLLNNYQPEYGQSAGAIVNLVTKSGTKSFHGEGYYFNRNEAFNANDTFNKNANARTPAQPNGIPRPRNRFNTIGYNFGGPIYWPGKFNADKNKLFFFFSQEIWPTESPAGPKFFMMPTALEKSGDFSKSVDSNGDPITLKDPKNCGAAGNLACLLNPTHVNPAFINQNTLALLNILPTGNPVPLGTATGGGLYNFVINPTRKQPVNQQVFRLDYNISDKWRLAFHGMNMSNKQTGTTATAVPGAMQWGIPFFYDTPARNAGINLTYAATSTLVNEFTFGYADWREFTGLANSGDLAKLQRNTTGVNLGQFNSSANPLNIVPRITFGGGGTSAAKGFGIANGPQIGFDNRFPFNNNTGNWEFSDGLTKVWNRHTFKVGAYGQKGRYVQHPIGNIFDGQFGFDVNPNNTLDSGYAYANALIGNYNNYQEGTRTVYAPKWKLFEWYLQDNWKITSRLTLDYGARFSYDFPMTLKTGDGVTLVPSRYDPTQVPALYQPIAFASLNAAQKALCNNNQGGSGKCGQNPNNPADIKPNAAIGTFVAPWSFTGSVINNDPAYPHALRNSNGVLVAPRLGISWDPFGDGKTAIRAGAGVFYNLRE
ncbi:MAG TPA: TonB-dependent receptor, partial [Terriglobales bacterium]|nr:TonB-dependent receptor [Terriglobales bacterium]